jgi:hypothetical protein
MMTGAERRSGVPFVSDSTRRSAPAVELLKQRGWELFDASRHEILFAKDPDANALLNDREGHPHAFVMACVCDRQDSAERVWRIPFLLGRRLGSVAFADGDPEDSPARCGPPRRQQREIAAARVARTLAEARELIALLSAVPRLDRGARGPCGQRSAIHAVRYALQAAAAVSIAAHSRRMSVAKKTRHSRSGSGIPATHRLARSPMNSDGTGRGRGRLAVQTGRTSNCPGK